jgi:glycosyltransferase involved in cell wall biosynthesis
MIAERHISGVTFAGCVDRAKIATMLQIASMLVLPSAQENAPMAIAEAMAAGTPVLATSVGGVPEMVRNGDTGFLYQPGDIAALVEHAGRLLRDPVLRTEFGRRAYRLARERYAPSAVASATVNVYRGLLNLWPEESTPLDGHSNGEH